MKLIAVIWAVGLLWIVGGMCWEVMKGAWDEWSKRETT